MDREIETLELEKERDIEYRRRIERKLSAIFREILNLESKINAIESKKELLKAKSVIEDNEREIQEIRFRSLTENRYIDDRMKEFNERW